jgi:hypothetical protein
MSLQTPVMNALTETPLINDNWMQCLIVAPTTIQLLGQLLVVSSKTDVSLKESASDHVFKYIRNPQSLRATLVQISTGKKLIGDRSTDTDTDPVNSQV